MYYWHILKMNEGAGSTHEVAGKWNYAASKRITVFGDPGVLGLARCRPPSRQDEHVRILTSEAVCIFEVIGRKAKHVGLQIDGVALWKHLGILPNLVGFFVIPWSATKLRRERKLPSEDGFCKKVEGHVGRRWNEGGTLLFLANADGRVSNSEVFELAKAAMKKR